MAKNPKLNGVQFGKRLAELRKARGVTQRELAKKIGASQRRIAYYEDPNNKYIPADLLPAILKVLKVSADELLGIKDAKHQLDPDHAALWRKLKKITNLPRKDQKALLQVLDSLLKQNKSK